MWGQLLSSTHKARTYIRKAWRDKLITIPVTHRSLLGQAPRLDSAKASRVRIVKEYTQTFTYTGRRVDFYSSNVSGFDFSR